METYSGVWKTVKGSESVPTFGFQYTVGIEPVSVNLNRMIDRFRLGLKELIDIWRIFLPEGIIDFLYKTAELPKEKFHIPDEIWVEIIYRFAIASHRKVINKEQLLKSLTPLYIGRTASFVIEVWESDATEVEAKTEQLCKMFEDKRYILLENWD